MEEPEVSPEQRATRRRALGRKIAASVDKVNVEAHHLRDTPDRRFLDGKEDSALTKQFDALNTVTGNLRKLATRLESK